MKNKNRISWIILISILFITSVGTYLCYPMIKDVISKENFDLSEISQNINSDIYYYNYAIDLDLKAKNNDNTDPSQYIKIEGPQNGDAHDSIQGFMTSIDHTRSSLQYREDIFYQATNIKTNQKTSNTDDDLSTLNTNKELQNKYQWYVQYQFDEFGHVSILYANDQSLDTSLFDTYTNEYYNSNTEEVSTTTRQNPQNLKITYAVPKTLPQDSQLYIALQDANHSQYAKYASPYILCGIAFTVLFILMTPFSILSENKFLIFISKIKFAILAWIWGVGIFMIGVSCVYVMSYTSQNIIIKFYQEFAIEKAAPVLTPLLNIGLWAIFYLFFIILVFMIKYLFNKGLKNYFKENTCVGWLIDKSKIIFNKVIDFDLNDDINKVVLKIVFFNFIIMIGVSIFFVFGFFFASIYSIIIFILIKRKFNEIKDDYQVLLNQTRQLSHGNFDINISEDVGIFNPLKEEFSHIKDGFEQAVQEEVKSQKTKSELISNVSHDLKTPLTSIITYVDLLKNTQLSQEEREQYIQILERNSLRLKNLIDDLFEVSKANSGDIKLDYVDVDIISLIKQAQLECQDKLDERQLDVRINFPEEKVICYLDSSKTYRIFENLFMNISKYALERTRVYVDMNKDEHDITITFKNISEEEMHFNENEIVERFVQGDKSRNTSGSGLGLAIVKSFVELQGGQLHIDIDGDLFKSTIILPIKGNV